MRTVVAALALISLVASSPVFAQAPAPQAPAKPAVQAPAPAPTQPPRPFPQGAKFAYLNIQRVANESAEGKAATARVKALNDKKVAELNDKNKQAQAAKQKLDQGQSVLSEQARGQLEKEIERLQVEIQRFTQDAQAEVQELQQELQADFQKKLIPVINTVATDMGLQMVFSQVDSGIVWADTGLDLTAEVIKRFDAATSSAAKPGQ